MAGYRELSDGRSRPVLRIAVGCLIWGIQAGSLSTSIADEQVEKLVQQLGSPEYAVRTQAKAQLEHLGARAYDALFAAQNHEDIEVRLTVEDLLQRIQIRWEHPGDPPTVQAIMRHYGKMSLAVRKSRMDRLAELEKRQGIGALCRIARYDPSEVLSKLAALQVLSQAVAADSLERDSFADQLVESLQSSQRTAAKWIRIYADTLRDPSVAAERWETIVSSEFALYQFDPENGRTSREIVRDLMRWQIDQLLAAEQTVAAQQVMQQTLSLVDGSRLQIVDTIDWLLQREAWDTIELAFQQFPSSFESDSLLLYYVAEVRSRQGRDKEAEQAAKLAGDLLPQHVEEHIEAALQLLDRGFLKWAEKEYRHAIDQAEKGSLNEVRTRFLLADLLADQQLFHAAAQVLQVVVDQIQQRQAVRATVEETLGRTAGSVIAQMHYYYSRHFAATSQQAEEMQHLELGNQNDPLDPDVLIAMFHLQGATDAWQQRVRNQIEACLGKYQDQISRLQREMNEAPNEQLRNWAARRLAVVYNQWAWLVGNTEGDVNEAIRISHRSLELRPNTASYLDTLGRCYCSKGDLENAVRYQKRAVQLEPHSESLRRRLAEFEQALRDSKVDSSS